MGFLTSSFSQIIPTYTIAKVRGANAFEGGMADSIGKKCKIVGVVYGDNFRASNNGITFSLKDQTGWIGLFKENTNFGLNLQEGDSIRAIGTVSGFNGLSQITLDSVKVLETNRPLVQPQVVTSLNESTESRLVKLVGWNIINPAEWTTGSGSGFTVRINKGIDTIDLRIDNDCEWFNKPVPVGVLDIIGLGGQFDGSIPRNSGYQLLPRRLSDIFVQGTTLKGFFPNTSSGVSEGAGITNIGLNLNLTNTTALEFNVFIKSTTATAGQDFNFTNPTPVTFSPNQTSKTFSLSLIDDAAAELPENINFVIRPGNGTTANLIGADSIFVLTISDNDGGASLIPTYNIGTVRGNNSINGGLPDSLNIYCRLRGTVYGSSIVSQTSGFQFTLRDATGGISMYSPVTLLGNMSEGDSVSAVGKIVHLNGLAQLRVDSIRRIAIGKPIKTPTIVNGVNEQTESDLIKLLGFQLVKPAEWTTGVGASGFSARIFKGSDTLRMRVDDNTSLYFDPAPTTAFNVTGIGWQSDISNPFNSGYQIMPRGSIDIQPIAANPSVVFPQAASQANEDAGTINFNINLITAGSTITQATLVVKGGTASIGSDFTISTNPNLSFNPGTTSQQAGVTILDDAIQELDETIILVLRSSNGSQIGPDSIFTITITDNDQPGVFVPTYNIGLLRGNNSFEGGVADSINVTCKINGTLYGPNLRGINNGIQFTVRDATGGINIFKNSSNFGLNFVEGDSVRAIGKVAQFNGLSQLNIDSIVLLATGRTLKTPTLVDSLSEAWESDLVKVTGYSIQNPSQWTTGAGTGFTVKITTGTRTLDLRIDNDNPLFSLPVPTGNILSIIGLVGQFDSSIPRNSGYQLFPRRLADIEIETGVKEAFNQNTIAIYPNPGNGRVTFKFKSDQDQKIDLLLFNALGETILQTSGNEEEVGKITSVILSNKPMGIYHFRLLIGNELQVKTLIKN